MSKQTTVNPIPQGNYVPAVRFGQLVYTAGMTPRLNGKLIQSGKVRPDVPLEDYRDAVVQAVSNALTAARNTAGEGEDVVRILSMTVYVNAAEGFLAFAKIADFASDYLFQTLGQAGIGSRASIGVAALPGEAPVEIQLVAAIGQI